MNLPKKRVAVVCDWIKDWGGAELVLEQVLEIFPESEIFTSVFYSDKKIFKNKKIHTSFIQKIPLINKSHKLALFFRPLAFESFDLSEFDIVISMCSAESKGVITKPETLHICYIHTPTRYFWSHYHEYRNMMEFGIFNFIGKIIMPFSIHKLRLWDFIASKRPDYYLANSENTKNRVFKYYKRESDVLYPSIDLSEFKLNEEKEDFYIYVGRCIPYKKFDLIVDSFNKNGKKIVIFTNTDNKLYRYLKSKSKSNIEWRLSKTRSEIIEYYGRSKGFVFPPEEDFGLVPVEAMACGTPVIAFGKGGATETVIENETGIFFEEQTSESLNKALEKFENIKFDYKKIRKRSEEFSKEIFKEKFLKFIEQKKAK